MKQSRYIWFCNTTCGIYDVKFVKFCYFISLSNGIRSPNSTNSYCGPSMSVEPYSPLCDRCDVPSPICSPRPCVVLFCVSTRVCVGGVSERLRGLRKSQPRLKERTFCTVNRKFTYTLYSTQVVRSHSVLVFLCRERSTGLQME